MPHPKNKSITRGNQYLRQSLAAAVIIVIVVVAIVIGGTGPGPNIPASTSAVFTPQQSPPVKLAKEYIYAGDRLVATEEGGLPPPTNLSALLWCSAHLSWRDNSQTETGFKLETLNADGVTWSLFMTLPANTERQWWLSRIKQTVTYRVRAFNNDGDSAPSNSITVPGRAPGSICLDGSPGECTPPTGLIVNEFRLRGPSGSNDEYVELTNNTDQALTVCSPDASSGWAVVTSDGTIRFVIPNRTVIPARGHYLAAAYGYSLGSDILTSADLVYPVDAPDNSGLALFNTAYPASFTLANRLDAVGFTNSADLYREGTGLSLLGANAGDYAFFRKLNGGYPADTGNNSADFSFVAVDAGLYGGLQAILGAPSPENLRSPIQRNAQLPVTVIDPAVGPGVAPNRVRDTTAIGPNAAFGTLTLRRKITNNTGSNVTKLRFRITDITTLNSPGYVPGGSQADMRVLNSNDVNVTITGGQTILVRGTTLESPPSQPNGGGLNSALTTGVISLSQPLLPGQSINVQLALGVQQGGSFRFFFNLEALLQ